MKTTKQLLDEGIITKEEARGLLTGNFHTITGSFPVYVDSPEYIEYMSSSGTSGILPWGSLVFNPHNDVIVIPPKFIRCGYCNQLNLNKENVYFCQSCGGPLDE